MKTVVYAFGRLNPPTSGHELLVEAVVATAKRYNGEPRIYLSQKYSVGKTSDDPLQFTEKVKFAQEAFGKIVQDARMRTAFEVLDDLATKSVDTVVYLHGSDSEQNQMAINLGRYAATLNLAFKHETLQRGGTGAKGMSATKMRDFVRANKLGDFLDGCPKNLSRASAKQMFDVLYKRLVL